MATYRCTNCNREASTYRGGAKGLCARCWKYQRRHGALPPPTPVRTLGPSVDTHLHLPAMLAARIHEAAIAAGVSQQEWIRAACELALDGLTQQPGAPRTDPDPPRVARLIVGARLPSA